MSGKKDAKKAAAAEAKAGLRVTQEKISNLREEERQMAGQTRAGFAGSNVKSDTGSPLTVLAEQARTFAKERMITGQVGAEQAALTKKRGKMAGQQAMWSGIASGFSQASNAFSMGSQANWHFGKQPGPG